MPTPLDKGLYRSDLLACLQNRDLFAQLIDRRIFDEATRYGCRVECNKARLYTAHDFFIDDYGRVLQERMPNGTETLDHFKLGAYVGFWIRRQIPINSVYLIQTTAQKLSLDSGEYDHVTLEQEFFSIYGNELAAFRIAYEIVHYCEVCLAADGVSDRVKAILASEVLQPSERTVREVAITLKHKNNSPHSLYITLLSLFDPLLGSA